MSMNPVPRKLSEEEQNLVEAFLKNGGTVTQCEKFKQSENVEYTGGFYGRKKKTKED